MERAALLTQEKFREALTLAPNDPAVCTNLAWALVRQQAASRAILGRIKRFTLVGKSDDEALGHIRKAIRLQPGHPDPYFEAGIVHFKIEDYKQARKDFTQCWELDSDHVEAERNIRIVEFLMREERRRVRTSAVAGYILGTFCLLSELALWTIYLHLAPHKVSSTMVGTLTPIFLGLAFVGFLLPSLIKLKIPGLEAELTKPQEQISQGPVGTIIRPGGFQPGVRDMPGRPGGHAVEVASTP